MKKDASVSNGQENKAREIHEKAIVIEGLAYRCEGYDDNATKGGVTAVHITVAPYQGGLREALDSIGKMLGRLEGNQDKWMLARTTSDILQAKSQGKVCVIFGFQNAKPIDDNLDNLYLFRSLGVRIIQITYNERNSFGDGCLERTNSGLSRFGVSLVKAMNKLGILIDLSHVGERTTLDAIEHSEAPVVFTHSNPKVLFENPRNKSDEQIRAMASRGGVIGISAYGPICWDERKGIPPTMDDVTACIDYAVNLVGVDHVGIGNDFPMGVPRYIIDQIINVTNTNYPQMSGEYNRVVGNSYDRRYAKGFESLAKFPNVTLALVQKGYSDEDISKILGGNFLRVFKDVWERGGH
jgi:membrane dipeptidase